jgi:hypothetical protein
MILQAPEVLMFLRVKGAGGRDRSFCMACSWLTSVLREVVMSVKRRFQPYVQF